jgi:hypothetical protein
VTRGRCHRAHDALGHDLQTIHDLRDARCRPRGARGFPPLCP